MSLLVFLNLLSVCGWKPFCLMLFSVIKLMSGIAFAVSWLVRTEVGRTSDVSLERNVRTSRIVEILLRLEIVLKLERLLVFRIGFKVKVWVKTSRGLHLYSRKQSYLCRLSVNYWPKKLYLTKRCSLCCHAFDSFTFCYSDLAPMPTNNLVLADLIDIAPA